MASGTGGSTKTTGKATLVGVFADAVLGLVVLALLAAVLSALEPTGLGRAVRGAYEAFAMWVSNPLNPPTPLARVINVDGLQYGTQVDCVVDGRRSHIPTMRRDMLYAIIEGIVADDDAKPYSVGVDVDFGPCANDYVVPGDAALFDKALSLQQPRPPDFTPRVGRGAITFGTYRGARDDPSFWLVEEKYAGLAGYMGIPDEPGRVAWSVHRAGASRVGYGLAERLAFPSDTTPPEDTSPWARIRIADQETASGVSAVRLGVTPVDFRPLALIRDRTLPVAPKSVAEARATLAALARAQAFKDEIILIAAIHRQPNGTYDDSYDVPGFGLVPGALVHVTAANSLRSSRYFLLRPGVRIALDLAFSLLVVAIVAGVRVYALRTRSQVKSDRLSRVLFAMSACTLIVVSGALLAFGRIMWDDVLLLAAFMAIHPSCEVFTRHAIANVRKSAVKFKDSMIETPADEGAR